MEDAHSSGFSRLHLQWQSLVPLFRSLMAVSTVASSTFGSHTQPKCHDYSLLCYAKASMSGSLFIPWTMAPKCTIIHYIYLWRLFFTFSTKREKQTTTKCCSATGYTEKGEIHGKRITVAMVSFETICKIPCSNHWNPISSSLYYYSACMCGVSLKRYTHRVDGLFIQWAERASVWDSVSMQIFLKQTRHFSKDDCYGACDRADCNKCNIRLHKLHESSKYVTGAGVMTRLNWFHWQEIWMRSFFNLNGERAHRGVSGKKTDRK